MQRKKKTGTDAVVTANHQRERSSTEPKADAGKTRLGSKGTMKGAKRITASKTTANKPRQGACPRSVQQGSTNLSPSLEIEQLAAEVTAEFSTVCAKLSEPKPKIEKIQSYFRESGRWSVTVEAKAQFFAIINTKSIKPWIVGDVPNAGDYAYRPIASPLRAAETDATPAQG